MERYDIAVIGTGPAGMEAAITAKVRNKKVLLLGSRNLSEKVEKAHTVQNYLGLPEVSGEKMQQAFLGHLDRMEIPITEDRVNAVYDLGGYFALQGHRDMYETSTVILACGLSASKPFPGEKENLGRGVSYCATCDAALYRGKTAIVVAYSKDDEREGEFLAEIADGVDYLPMYEGAFQGNDKIRVITDRKPKEIQKADGRMQLVTDRTALTADGIFLLRQDVAPSQLVPGLALAENHVAVDRSMQTNIAGLFACGDITGPPYQYIKAAGEGNVAVLSAVRYLADKM